MLKLLFLVSLAITIVLSALQILGTQTLDLIIIMIIIDFLSLGAYLEVEKNKADKETKGFITIKLEGIEKVCNDILNHVISPNPGFEAKLEKQKDDMNYILDKIAKKSLELEEKLNIFGKVLSNNINGKTKVEEEPSKTEETEEEEKEQEETAETFNVGEIVYVEDEDNK
jgi:hypothetical protein